MQIIREHVKEISSPVATELRKLTLPFGMMKGRFDYCRRNPLGSWVYYVRINRKIVAWGLVWRRGPNKRAIYLYVDKQYRRQGIASALMSMIEKDTRRYETRVYPWDETSRLFYNNFPNHER